MEFHYEEEEEAVLLVAAEDKPYLEGNEVHFRKTAGAVSFYFTLYQPDGSSSVRTFFSPVSFETRKRCRSSWMQARRW